jgi:hypothetical protein
LLLALFAGAHSWCAEYERSSQVLAKRFNAAVLAAARRFTGVLRFCRVADAVADPSVFQDDFYAGCKEDVWTALDQFVENVREDVARACRAHAIRLQEGALEFSSSAAQASSSQELAAKHKRDKEDSISRAAAR